MTVERLSPELDRLVSADRELEELGNGYQVAEGPLWWKEEGHLIFSEVRGDRRRKWTPGGGIALLQEPDQQRQRVDQGLAGTDAAVRGRRGARHPDGNPTAALPWSPTATGASG